MLLCGCVSEGLGREGMCKGSGGEGGGGGGGEMDTNDTGPASQLPFGLCFGLYDKERF